MGPLPGSEAHTGLTEERNLLREPEMAKGILIEYRSGGCVRHPEVEAPTSFLPVCGSHYPFPPGRLDNLSQG